MVLILLQLPLKQRSFAVMCFVASGTAAIAYQVLWLRFAMSYFGVITPVISTLLGVFMLGLTSGTYAGTRWARALSSRQALRAYAAVEALIAVCALSAPSIFKAGYHLLLTSFTWGAYDFFLVSALIIFLGIFPACLLIGATLPLMMRILQDGSYNKNFGILYCSNLAGALLGCGLPLVLAELLGLNHALLLTTLLNFGVAVLAYMQWKHTSLRKAPKAEETPAPVARSDSFPIAYKIFLFVSGFVAVGSELLWTKSFAPITSSSVYAFAVVLAVYLACNALGNLVYLRESLVRGRVVALAIAPALALLTTYAISVEFLFHHHILTILSIAPISFLFGYLTPWIIDKAGQSSLTTATTAYIYNCVGCILGPLVTGYALFPLWGLRDSFFIHAGLLLVAVLLLLKESGHLYKLAACFLFAILGSFITLFPDFEDFAQDNGVLYRDPVGYVAAYGSGMMRSLTVNGLGMTKLSMITKDMFYLPAAYHGLPLRNALIICMGMGNTLRAATKLPAESITQVELSAGVVKTFPYFHEDADDVLKDPRVHIVVDDGRRFLARNQTTYDVIAIDPPPPVEASGSGLLYTSEFMDVLSSRLAEGGILSQWFPEEDRVFLTSTIISSIKKNFEYVKIIHSAEGWGLHILASHQPIPPMTPKDYLARLPAAAKQDLLEYDPSMSLKDIAQRSLQEDTRWAAVLPSTTPPISDDHLYNEFFLLRSFFENEK